MTSLGQFINLGLITLLTVYFESYIEDDLSGRIVFRIIRTLYPCCNVFLTFILDRWVCLELIWSFWILFNARIFKRNFEYVEFYQIDFSAFYSKKFECDKFLIKKVVLYIFWMQNFFIAVTFLFSHIQITLDLRKLTDFHC